jgi:hypothetical protein
MASTAAMAKDEMGESIANREPSPFVKLISAEGHEFYVDRKCALVSGTIKSMLQSEWWCLCDISILNMRLLKSQYYFFY